MLNNSNTLLITNPQNIYYLTGFKGLAPHEREAYVIYTSDITYLFTNPLYSEQAERVVRSRQWTVRSKKIEFVEISREKPLAFFIQTIMKKNNLLTLGFEEDNLTVSELRTLEKELSEFTFVPTRDRIEEMRKYKKPNEIESIKKACALTDDCFAFVQTKLKPGVTESEIAWEIESFFKKYNAENAFPPIVAFGANSSQPHHQSSDISLQTSDLILLDFGAKIDGYCADMTRMVFIGEPKKEWHKAYEALKNAQQKALDLLVSGQRSGSLLDQAVRDELAKYNFPPYPHSLGHAVGLAIHEAPRLSVRRDEELKPGMVFSVEPGIYVPGQFGIRIEDLILLSENGIEVLSKSTKEMVIL